MSNTYNPPLKAPLSSPIAPRPAGIAPAAVPPRGIAIGTAGTFGNAATTEIIRVRPANQR